MLILHNSAQPQITINASNFLNIYFYNIHPYSCMHEKRQLLLAFVATALVYL